MKTIRFVPGAVASPAAITIPNTAPAIAAVISAQIVRPAAGLADHPAASVIAGVTNHLAAAVIAGVVNHPAANVIAGVTTHLAAAVAAAMGNHPQADIVGAIANHAVHTHPLLISAGGAGAPNEAFGASAAAAANIQSATGQLIPSAAVGGGVQNNAAAQAHAVGAAPVDHAGAGALVHVAGAPVAHGPGAAVAHVAGVAVAHTGADPVVAAVPTIITARTFSLNVNTLVGDLLTLSYVEVGERIPVS